MERSVRGLDEIDGIGVFRFWPTGNATARSVSRTRLQSAFDLRRPNPLGPLVAVLPQQLTHASQQNLRETASSFDSVVFARVLRRSGLVPQANTSFSIAAVAVLA